MPNVHELSRRILMWPVIFNGNRRHYALVGSWTNTTHSASPYYVTSVANALNASTKIRFRGTVFGMVVDGKTNNGIVTVTIDGINPVAVDLYNAVSTTNNYHSVLTHTDLADTEHEATLEITGKNASSSDYTFNWFAMLVDETNGEFAAQIVIAPSTTTIQGSINVTGTATTTSSSVGFWSNSSVSPAGVSSSVNSLNGSSGRLRVSVNVSAATTITVQYSFNNSAWYDGETIEFVGSGTHSLLVSPNYGYVRLKSSAAAVITAGYSQTSWA